MRGSADSFKVEYDANDTYCLKFGIFFLELDGNDLIFFV